MFNFISTFLRKNLDYIFKYFDNLDLLSCIFSLGIAFFVEYFYKIIPCNLCYLERVFLYFYILLFFCYKLNFIKSKIFNIIQILNFAIGLIVSFYHLSLEQGWIVSSCDFDFANLSNNVNCAIVRFWIFGMSLTSLIFIFYLCILFLSCLKLVKDN